MRIEEDPRTGRVVGYLGDFDILDQVRYALAAMRSRPPAQWLVGEIYSIPSREYYEWYAERGINPYDPKRRKRIPERLRNLVIERDGNLCGICALPVEEPPHLDHIHPLMHGGKDELDNLQVAHPSCNIRKGATVGEGA